MADGGFNYSSESAPDQRYYDQWAGDSRESEPVETQAVYVDQEEEAPVHVDNMAADQAESLDTTPEETPAAAPEPVPVQSVDSVDDVWNTSAADSGQDGVPWHNSPTNRPKNGSTEQYVNGAQPINLGIESDAKISSTDVTSSAQVEDKTTESWTHVPKPGGSPTWAPEAGAVEEAAGVTTSADQSGPPTEDDNGVFRRMAEEVVAYAGETEDDAPVEAATDPVAPVRSKPGPKKGWKNKKGSKAKPAWKGSKGKKPSKKSSKGKSKKNSKKVSKGKSKKVSKGKSKKGPKSKSRARKATKKTARRGKKRAASRKGGRRAAKRVKKSKGRKGSKKKVVRRRRAVAKKA